MHLKFYKPFMLEDGEDSVVYRQMISNLNRLTDSSMPIILQETFDLPISHPNNLGNILRLIIHKAQDEPIYVKLYAKFCKSLVLRFHIEHELRTFSILHFEQNLSKLLDFDFPVGSLDMEEVQKEYLSRKRLTIHLSFMCALECEEILCIEDILRVIQILLRKNCDRSIELICKVFMFNGDRINNADPELVNSCFEVLTNKLNNEEISTRLRHIILSTFEYRDAGWRPRLRSRSRIAVRNVRG